ncbi:ABC-F family ATP-binding cassette domain-containing protein [Mycoplasmatota bacterium]|nr:ABC-F family ATP-binding cassette domain-containing protein [Mycoplasmatota bacterium]
MNLITVNHLKKSFGVTSILDNINLSLNSHGKMAIVGRNGAGKSTLVKIICGLETYDSGNIYLSSNLKLGYFSQDSLINSEEKVIDEMSLVFDKQITLKKKLDKLANQLNTTSDEETLTKYTNMLQTFEEIGGYTFEYHIETILNKFGFKDYYHHQVNQLSGGQRTRLALAKLLLSEPDLLILDEPTNHLDLETVEFLENFLKSYKHAIIIISHDRYFLNQVVNQVYEIEFNQGFLYKGNYDSYLTQKNERYEHMKKQFDLQQKMIQKEQEFINKNIVRATTSSRAKSRRKKLEKIEVLENPNVDNKNIKVNFDFSRNTGNIVLDVQNLSIGYEEPFLNNIDFLIKKGEKVAILGPNGIGKSTLLKTLNKAINPLGGNIKYGAGVNIAYFDQDLAMLHSNNTVLDELWDENRMMLEKDIRGVLGSFLFTGDDVFKCVNDLSGGEKVRLALSKLTLVKANLLILDEVTNHLDILSREVLESALINFPGTIIFVSHDRFFINQVATRIIEITIDEVVEYIGDYNYYIEKKKEANLIEETKKETNANHFMEQKKLKSEQKKRQKKIDNLEEEIAQLEDELHQLKIYQQTEEVYSDYQKAQDVHDTIEHKQKQLDDKIHSWTELIEEIDQL